jgi:hypothetical protein
VEDQQGRRTDLRLESKDIKYELETIETKLIAHELAIEVQRLQGQHKITVK